MDVSNTPKRSGYAPVNGLKLYYEIYGEGSPLILIHGGLGGVNTFIRLIPFLAEIRQVIVVELQGHGHTADIDRLLTYEDMADDIAALITYLSYDVADVLGYSLGGGVALQLAIRHPASIQKLVLISTPFARSGIHPEFASSMETMRAELMQETPMYQFYSAVAPQPEAWKTLVSKLVDLLRKGYDWSNDVVALTVPIFIIAGDGDMIPPQHAVDMFALLGGGVPGDFIEKPNTQLAILPDTTHLDILSKVDVSIITNYLTNP